jgi:hypothetical protein
MAQTLERIFRGLGYSTVVRVSANFATVAFAKVASRVW